MATKDLTMSSTGTDVMQTGVYHYQGYNGGSDYTVLNDASDDTYHYIYLSYFCSGGWSTDQISYNAQDFSESHSSITSVKLTARMYKNMSQSTDAKVYCRTSGGTRYYGSSTTVGDSWTEVTKTWTTDPSTSAAWTASGINAMEWGYYMQLQDYCSGSYNTRASYLRVTVTYVVPAPSVTTNNKSHITSLTTTGATLEGNITATAENSTIRGFQYDTDTGSPYANDAHDDGSYSTGEYTKAISSLTAGTKYYYRAYATNPGGTGYGSEYTFITPVSPSTTIGLKSILDRTISVKGSFSTLIGFIAKKCLNYYRVVSSLLGLSSLFNRSINELRKFSTLLGKSSSLFRQLGKNMSLTSSITFASSFGWFVTVSALIGLKSTLTRGISTFNRYFSTSQGLFSNTFNSFSRNFTSVLEMIVSNLKFESGHVVEFITQISLKSEFKSVRVFYRSIATTIGKIGSIIRTFSSFRELISSVKIILLEEKSISQYFREFTNYIKISSRIYKSIGKILKTKLGIRVISMVGRKSRKTRKRKIHILNH